MKIDTTNTIASILIGVCVAFVLYRLDAPTWAIFGISALAYLQVVNVRPGDPGGSSVTD